MLDFNSGDPLGNDHLDFATVPPDSERKKMDFKIEIEAEISRTGIQDHIPETRDAIWIDFELQHHVLWGPDCIHR